MLMTRYKSYKIVGCNKSWAITDDDYFIRYNTLAECMIKIDEWIESSLK